MKKTMLLAIYILVLFCSFTTTKDGLPVLHKKNLSAPTGVSFTAKGSYTWDNVTGLVCDGSEIDFPSLTITYDYHGVYNGQSYMIQGTDKLYGTGISTSTTENFVADFKTKFNEKFPLVNGAYVFREKITNSFTGDQGTVDAFSLKYHLTFDANGVLDEEKTTIEFVCE